MLASLFLELSIGAWGIYVGIVAYCQGALCGLPEAVYASLVVLLALQSLLMYNSSRGTTTSRIFVIYLTVMEYVAKIGVIIGFILVVVKGIEANTEYYNGDSYKQSLFDILWSLVTAGWAWIALCRVFEMMVMNNEEEDDDDLCLLKEDDKKIMEYYGKSLIFCQLYK